MIPIAAYIGDTPLSAMMLGDISVMEGGNSGKKDLVLYPSRSFLQNTDYSEDASYVVSSVYNYLDSADGTSSTPKAVTLTFQNETTSLTIYNDSQHTQQQQTLSFSSSASCDVFNLIPNKTYYWVAGNGESGSFETTGLVRWCRLSGCTNIRDFGGRKTTDNKVVKFGKLFRGSEMNGKHGYQITAEGISVAKNVLGIGAELDLRNEGETDGGTPDDYSDDITTSALGNDVPYIKAPILAYSNISNTLAELKTAWDFILAQSRLNHGIIFHCWAGADRTGTLAWLLNMLLGVDRSECDKDYELTSFTRYGNEFIWRSRNSASGFSFDDFVTQYISSFSGTTLYTKVENFWKSIGVTSSEIVEFRSLMLE